LHLEKFGVRVCDLILGPPSCQVRLADRLEEVIRRLWAKQVVRQETDTEMEALATLPPGSKTWCWKGLMGHIPWWHRCPRRWS
jgi:hypothetical protein